MSCPECGHTFRIEYGPDPETAETGNDHDAEDDDDEPEYEDRKASLAKELGRQVAIAGQPKDVTARKHSAKSRRLAAVDGVLTEIFD